MDLKPTKTIVKLSLIYDAFIRIKLLSGDNMLQFGLGLLVGLVVAALVWYNNKAKFEAAVTKAIEDAKKLKAKI